MKLHGLWYIFEQKVQHKNVYHFFQYIKSYHLRSMATKMKHSYVVGFENFRGMKIYVDPKQDPQKQKQKRTKVKKPII